MKLSVQRLQLALEGKYSVAVEESASTTIVRCVTPEGAVIAIRIFSSQQLQNQALVDLVLEDLAKGLR